MTKILLTGGCGFLFSNFLRKSLIEKSNYQFISIDNCQNPNNLFNIYLNKDHRLHIGNIQDIKLLETIFKLEKPDIVIHGADDHNQAILETNIIGTQTIIQVCQKYHIKKFIHLSTDKVYTASSDPKTEESPLSPISPYLISKVSAEMLIKISGLHYNILRLSNIYGPRQNTNKLVPYVIKNILNDTEIILYQNGLQSREWLYVEDACSAISLIMEKGVKGEIYNVSSNYEFTNLELTYQICKLAGKGDNLVKCVEGRGEHSQIYATNSEKIKELGWTPVCKPKTALATTYSWFEKNRWYFNQESKDRNDC